jgi:tight adherence protein B
VSFGRVRGPATPRHQGLRVDLVMDLVACALLAGLTVADALAVAAQDDSPGAGSGLARTAALIDLGADPAAAWREAPPAFEPLARALRLASMTGAPAAEIVSRAAADLREERTALAQTRAARLGVLLVVPLGLAVLPGFLLLAVVPIVLGLVGSLQPAIG